MVVEFGSVRFLLVELDGPLLLFQSLGGKCVLELFVLRVEFSETGLGVLESVYGKRKVLFDDCLVGLLELLVVEVERLDLLAQPGHVNLERRLRRLLPLLLLAGFVQLLLQLTHFQPPSVGLLRPLRLPITVTCISTFFSTFSSVARFSSSALSACCSASPCQSRCFIVAVSALTLLRTTSRLILPTGFSAP